MKQVLLVDDDALLRRSLAFNLEQNGFQVKTAASAEEALEIVRQNMPDIVLLDIGLPGIDGLEALRIFRSQFPVPIIFLTARRRDLDEVLGLELGADDYVTKPFNLDVLIAHMKSVLRRTGQQPVPQQEKTAITVGGLVVDPGSHTADIDGNTVELTPREFELLYALALDAGRVVSVENLLSRVWGAEYVGEPQVVYVHIRWLREKIEEDPNHPQRLVTVRGVGYKLTAQDSDAQDTAQSTDL